MTTNALATSDPADDPTRTATRRSALEHATVREILMGAQDNLTNVLAVMLGVSIGSGRAELVALAGMSAAVAEAVSMGGVLYSSTRAERALEARDAEATGASAGTAPVGLAPFWSGVATCAAALIGGLVPLAPFLL
ncbi:MAG: VIT1/CCC1 transporter family protein, partial [Chloroflexota bacterium]